MERLKKRYVSVGMVSQTVGRMFSICGLLLWTGVARLKSARRTEDQGNLGCMTNKNVETLYVVC